MSNYVVRDLIMTIPEELKKRKAKRDKEKRVKISKELERILFIGPAEHKCHIGENLYDCFVEEGFDCKFITPKDLNVKGNKYSLTNVRELTGDWIPNLIFIDECIFIENMQSIPVFYHQREFKRAIKCLYPSLAYFWHEDLIWNYETYLDPLGMEEIKHKRVLPIAYSPKIWQPKKKTLKGLYSTEFREGFEFVYKVNEIANVADWMILEKEHNEAKQYVKYYEGYEDKGFREVLPEMEAYWCPVMVRQYTTRVMLECMASKTLVILKLEDLRHEEILEEMGLKRDKHYVGIDELSELDNILKGIKNKDTIVEKAFKLVSEEHTYRNRMLQIIEDYNEVIGIK